ncbi:fimbria/pilus chaperone family protein [Pseudomonas yamanorum]|uniref:fimbria/pilus chaperone family protein n=1 Tax=Pseudomonas yamanorum TaxID=515393 RepID=UPI0008798177|nr:fimbria/pilus chaperone family protein [Pseudomonas yamanorum]SDT99425.1 P pilus assembly protein, chaperone PapD [Pseudomonas yamanorum]
MSFSYISKNRFVLAGIWTLFSGIIHASGMVPETSVVLINAGDGEGTINVTNTDDKAALLYVSMDNVPEDQENLVLVTPPISRVEAGEKQLVRFILQSEKPITTQRLKRVNFEGIPQKLFDSNAKVGVTVRQNLPVLITPSDLPLKADPWTLLKWTIEDKNLVVKNDSRYVVRLNQQLNITPSEIRLLLPRTYILPGQSVYLPLPTDKLLRSDAILRIYPVSNYGFAVKPFDVRLDKGQVGTLER